MSDLTVIVVDDEPLARERIVALVRETDGLQLIAEGRNGLDALDLIAMHHPDVVFIDVEMPELSGFGVIAALDRSHVPGVVFVTAYERYAVRAFDVGAIDYLHKPVTRPRFAAAVERVRLRLNRPAAERRHNLVVEVTEAERARGARTRFVVVRGTTHYFVPVREVDWIDAADNYLRLHVGEKVHLSRGTLKDAGEELDPAQFIRIHRSALVAIDRIVAIRPHTSGGGHVLELRSGARLRSSRQFADRVRALLK